MGFVYEICKAFFSLVLSIFFRDIEVVGWENIPLDGPVVFVGNHQNQFVDPLMLLAHCPRPISFLIAAKSMTRFAVGFFAKQVNAIPVERPQDIAKSGTGKITIKGKEVTGFNTKFTSELDVGACLTVEGMDTLPRVKEIKSQTSLILDKTFEKDPPSSVDFKILPKLDQTEVYETVWSHLENGNCIGIFPEGGSHDRTELLPLKAGVTLMALGTMARSDSTRVKIVPCGLNYFSGHRFRSHVVVEFGPPIPIKYQLVELYKRDKRAACAQLLEEIAESLKRVTIAAPTYETLQMIRLVQVLYKPRDIELDAHQYMELNRRFSEAYLSVKDEPNIKNLETKVLEYQSKLKGFGLKDHQVTVVKVDWTDAFILLVGRLVALVVLFALALPGFLLNAPIGLVARYLARKEATKAKKSSKVKIAGRDVIASYKIITTLVMVPLVHGSYFIYVTYYYGLLIGLLNLFIIQPTLGYSSIRILETGVLIYKSSIPLFYSLLPGSMDVRSGLLQQRNYLKREVRKVVNEYGPSRFPELFNSKILERKKTHKETFQSTGFEMKRRREYRTRPSDTLGDVFED